MALAMPKSEQLPRRRFLFRTIGFLTGSVSFPNVFSLAVWADDIHSKSADIEIAALGSWLFEHEPDLAVELEAEARRTAQISPLEKVDWKIAIQARERLTQPERVSAEIAREDVVFVDGWLLAYSEAGTALLFELARAQFDARSQARLLQ